VGEDDVGCIVEGADVFSPVYSIQCILSPLGRKIRQYSSISGMNFRQKRIILTYFKAKQGKNTVPQSRENAMDSALLDCYACFLVFFAAW
jgi:hypothetical protein